MRDSNASTDGHHKLVRWHFVSHCAIDGYSRLVLFLMCSNNSSTVYDSFLQSVQQYGLPSRVHCDQGGENMLVAHHMIHHRGSERRSVLVGSSVHNQHIERLWRTCTAVLLHFFIDCFIFLSTMATSSQSTTFTYMLVIMCICHRSIERYSNFTKPGTTMGFVQREDWHLTSYSQPAVCDFVILV